MNPAPAIGALLAALALLMGGCSVRQLAIKELGDALAGGGDVFAADDDPELVGDALPFSLKLMESVLAESPGHQGLLIALTSGFAQYAYGWAQLEADYVEDHNYDRATELRSRAVKLYQRARGYGMRGLEQRHPGFSSTLREDTAVALAQLRPQDVELAYWTAMAWAGAIALSLDDMELVGDLGYVGPMMDRALELDPDWNRGALHSFFIQYEMSRMDGSGDPVENASWHYRRALELSEGRDASLYVAYAEAVAVELQDRELFEELLGRALAIDVDRYPQSRLMNILYQERARWLLTRMDWLFL